MRLINHLMVGAVIAAVAAFSAPSIANAQATSKENNATSGSMSHSKGKMKRSSKKHGSMKHRPASDKAKRAGA